MGRLLPLASLSKWSSLVLTMRRCIAHLALLGNNVEQSSIQCSTFGRLADSGPLGYESSKQGATIILFSLKEVVKSRGEV